MHTWVSSPHSHPALYDPERLQAAWPRLHRNDAEPPPPSRELLEGWVLFHNGAFQAAAQAGLALGDAGLNLANKATCIYANYLEPGEQRREALLLEAASRAEGLQERQPGNPGAWYWQGYALGRYSQGISVAKALANGLGMRIKQALERAIELAPEHADAHLALATFHAEVIDKVGPLIGRMTYGASVQAGLSLYQRAHRLNPQSLVTLIEHARGLILLEGQRQMPTAMALHERAANMEPLDAMERIYLAAAQAG